MQRPKIKEIKKIDFEDPKTDILKNDIPLYSFSGGTEDLTELSIIIKAGNWHEQKKLVAPITGQMLTEGTQDYSSHEFTEKLNFFGVDLEIETNLDYTSISFTTLNKHLENVLPLVREVITECTIPEKEFEIIVKNNIQNLKV
jgi:predicted Zn-dependent peptidase